MIKIYKNDCEDFNNNGLGILTDFKTSPKIKESLNSSFELNFDYALKGKNAEYLVVDNILKVPYDKNEQLFRIKKVTPTLTKINIYAVHIFYDLSENFLDDVAPTKKSGVNAISWILENTMFPNNFSVTGDLIPDNSARYVRKNPVEAILGADNCIVKRWGGEIERDNYNIILHNQRGSDKGVYIKQGKNIKEIEISIDFTSVVTRIVPQGANELLLPEYYVDSPLINTYRNPIVAKYEFSDISIDDETNEEQAYEKLREAAKSLFSKDNIDKPKIYVKVDWLELSKTEEYRYKYSNFESVRLGDTVIVQALGYEYKIRVVSIEYDCLLKRYTSFEIGDPKADYVERQISLVTNEIQKSSSSLLEKAKKAATTLINNGFGGHVRIYPDRILIMDTEDEATASNVWQWNLNGFAHSSTGINGEYETAITIDGQIVADRITTGTMDVQRINGLANELGKINTSIELNEKNITANVRDINDINNKIKLFDSKESTFPITIEKCAENKPIELKIYGESSQEKTNGYQLFDESKLPTKSRSGVTITNNSDGSFTISGAWGDSENPNYNFSHNYTHEETLELLKAGNITISDDGVVGNTSVPYYLMQLRNSAGTIFEISNRVNNSHTKNITQEMLNDESCYMRIGFYGASNTPVTHATIKPMLFQNGDGIFEKFTGGKISPSSEYPQNIKSVKGTRNLFDVNLFSNFTTNLKYINLTLEPNIIYTMSSNISRANSSTANLFFYKDGESPTTGKNSVSLNEARTLITDETGKVVIAYRNHANLLTDIDFKNDFWYMLNEGSVAKKFVSFGSWLRLKQTNKNICPTNFSFWESGEYNITGIKVNNSKRIRLKKLIKIDSNQEYNFNIFTNYFKMIVRVYDKNQTFSRSLGTMTEDNNSHSFNENEKFLSVTLAQFTDQEVTFDEFKEYFDNGTIKPFICLNSEADKSFVEHRENEYLLNMTRNNLFNVEEYVSKNSEYYSMDENKNVHCIKVDNRNSDFSYCLELPIGTYILKTSNKCNLIVYESDDNKFISSSVTFQRNNATQIIFTTTKNFVTFKTFNTTVPNFIGKIRLYEGLNCDEFFELASLKDIKDELVVEEEGNIKLVKNIEKIIVDGQMAWQLSDFPGANECVRYRTRQVLEKNSKTDYVGISDKFVTRLPNSEITDTEYILFSKGYFYISIKKSRLEENSENGFRNWLNNNPVTVFYLLDNTQSINISKINPIKTFKETNIFSLNQAALGNIKYYLDNDFQNTFQTITESNATIKMTKEEIENNVSTTYATLENLNGNYYTKTNVENLILNSETGVTNTFSEAGGNNVFRNTGLWFRENEEDTFEFWTGKAKKTTNDNATLRSSILLQAGKFKQEQDVPNGNYSISFFYTKLNPLATATVTINDKTYQLDSTETKQFYTSEKDEDGNYIVLPLEVNSGHLIIEFSTDINNSVEIYDLMANKGTVKLAYSQNQNETTTDTVNISKGITMISSVDDSMFKANTDGIRVLNKNNGEKITDFTDKGMTTKQAKIEEEADVCKAFFLDVGNQTWITRS